MSTKLDQMKLNFHKSSKLKLLTDEAKRMKVIIKGALEEAKKVLKSGEFSLFKQQVKSFLKNVDFMMNEARKMHFYNATPELLDTLDEYIKVTKEERRDLEVAVRNII